MCSTCGSWFDSALCSTAGEVECLKIHFSHFNWANQEHEPSVYRRSAFSIALRHSVVITAGERKVCFTVVANYNVTSCISLPPCGGADRTVIEHLIRRIDRVLPAKALILSHLLLTLVLPSVFDNRPVSYASLCTPRTE